MKNGTLEERVTRLEQQVEHLSDKTDEVERKLNAVFKKIEEMKESMHKHEINMVKEIQKIEVMVHNISSEIKWYGRLPTLIISALNFLVSALILLKLLGILKGGAS